MTGVMGVGLWCPLTLAIDRVIFMHLVIINAILTYVIDLRRL